MTARAPANVMDATKCMKTISAVQKAMVPTTRAAAQTKMATTIEIECSIRAA